MQRRAKNYSFHQRLQLVAGGKEIRLNLVLILVLVLLPLVDAGREDSMRVVLPTPEAAEDEAASAAAARIGALRSDVEAVLDGLASENQEEQRQALQIAKERGLLT